MPSHSLDLQTLQANSSSSKIKCRAEAPALFSRPSLCPQTQPLSHRYHLVLFYKLCHCADVLFWRITFISESFQEMRQSIRGVLHFQTSREFIFLLGFLTTCGQCFIYPDVGNNSNEQPSSEAALTSLKNSMWGPRGSLCSY